MVEDGVYQDVLDEIAAFPNGDHDDLVDTISGNILGFIYYCGGYQKLMDSKKIKQHNVGAVPDYQKDSLVETLMDEFSM